MQDNPQNSIVSNQITQHVNSFLNIVKNMDIKNARAFARNELQGYVFATSSCIVERLAGYITQLPPKTEQIPYCVTMQRNCSPGHQLPRGSK